LDADRRGNSLNLHAVGDKFLVNMRRQFTLTDQRVAKRKYCDVEKAFQEELGLGDYRNRPK
jgi:hypothetical protein